MDISMSTIIHLNTRHTSYIMSVLPTGHLQNLYYGRRIRPLKDAAVLTQPNAVPYGSMVAYQKEYPTIGLDDQCLEYSALGKGDYREPAIELTAANGCMVADFKYVCHKTYKGRRGIPKLPSALGTEQNCETTEVILRDEAIGMDLTLFYCVYPEYDVITRFVCAKNNSGQKITLRRLMSAQLDLFDSNYSFVTFDGTWASERTMHSRRLCEGIFVNDSKLGVSSARHNPFVMLTADGCTEETGRCYGMNLVYSGNHSEICEVTFNHKTRLLTGINPSSFAWLLAPGEEFYTPEAVFTYSEEGLNGLSHNLHGFVNNHIVRGEWQNRERPIVINNWEATSFSFTQGKLLSIAKEAADMGIELFVLDDGWFGRRNDDTSSLGDWHVNEKKLPSGLKGLAEKMNALGLDFGLWVEPEMVNEDSDLYRAHPDWAIKAPNRTPSEGRNQFILDLTRKEICDYLTETLSKVFSSANITYIKWDMNRNFSDIYSPTLPPERQGEFFHRYVLGLYGVLETLTQRFPKILFESCASGGNRFDLGMLCYMPQTWASDNTDAQCRIAIQEGTSYGYPISTMGAHVSASPCFATLRNTPIETRFNVAAFGCFGYELDLSKLFEFDKKAIKEQVAYYKAHRRVIQFGRFYRLRGGFNPDKRIWLCVSPDKREAVAALFQETAAVGRGNELLRLTGLDDHLDYTVTGRRQYVNLKTLGDLVNNVLPVEIRGDGVIHTVLSSHYMLAMCDEVFEAGGDLLNGYGIKLKHQFSGTGYNDNVKIFGDYSSRMYELKARE
ncbi:alpha-galactosidase [Acetanaerobacterium elongatum]|uniref:Alpha-galactosidase n=2 Tax=Acetanaerobacterium elongatum TaxID=258515 RepID=A0A1H0BZD2_9FIRM|nr:alpha-galactosidase [Acetanaerobacterium elongatum]